MPMSMPASFIAVPGQKMCKHHFKIGLKFECNITNDGTTMLNSAGWGESHDAGYTL